MENSTLPASPSSPPEAQPNRWAGVPWAVALTVCILAAYGNSFNGVFQYDDVRSIEHNESLRSFGQVFSNGENISRPLVALTFALDYALFGANPRGYHAINLGVHWLAALLLFGIVRRTLLNEKLRQRFGGAATPLAFAAALVWALHPLQTESVTYIVQRAESMMGMFFLLAMYCVIRGAESGSHPAWNTGAIAAAALGAGCKQVIAMLPFAVLFYDRCFISGSFKAALKRAPKLYLGLLVSWLIVGVLILLMPRIGSAGFALKNRTPFNYACSQFAVIVRYLRLAVLPTNQCLDYAWHTETDVWRILSRAAIVLALLAATIYQLCKNTAAGFCGAWFFVILAPTSSIMPIGDLAVEHRMYLSLAALTVLAVTIVYVLIAKLLASLANANAIALKATLVIFVLAGLGVGSATGYRNALYQDRESMLEDILDKRPNNPRAWVEMERIALQKGDLQNAFYDADAAVKLAPNDPETHCELAGVLLAQKNIEGAIAEYRKALDAAPNHARATFALADLFLHRGLALANAGQFDKAVADFNAVLALQSGNEDAICLRGKAFEFSGREAEAVETYRAALREKPDLGLAANALAWILATSANDKLRNGKEAVQWAESAVAQRPDKLPLMLDTLAAAYAENAQMGQAVDAANRALQLVPPDSPMAKDLRAHLELFKSGKPVLT